jgi:AcrR family transcriptional regulator
MNTASVTGFSAVSYGGLGAGATGPERAEAWGAMTRISGPGERLTDGVDSTKRQIVLTAERLFAEQGIAGVALRQIGLSAGSANKSAVQYHFGSKTELVQAIFDYRLGDLHARREDLAEQYGLDDVPSWLQCHIRALFEQADEDDSYYLRFLSQLVHQPAGPPRVEQDANFGERVRAFHDRLPPLLPHLAKPLCRHRIVNINNLILLAGATRESARQAKLSRLPFEAAVTDLVDATSCFLQAPVSVQTSTRSIGAKTVLLPFLF